MKTKPKLDYLFEADFANGTTYYQGGDDESLTQPADAEGNIPSAYRDIQDRMDEVTRFHLVGPAGRYTVDLTDGHFEVNGVPFYVERPDVPITDIQLQYLRYTNIDSTIEATADKAGIFNFKAAKEVRRAHYVSRYVIGFTAKVGAKEISHAIAIRGEN